MPAARSCRAKGGYTTIEGERCIAERGDLIFTPTGTWHDHGNEDAEPVIWADILDLPLLEYPRLQLARRQASPGALEGNARAQAPMHAAGLFAALYGQGRHGAELRPASARPLARRRRRCSITAAPTSAQRSTALRGETGDPYEGIRMRFVNPATGAPVFPTLDYSAQLLRAGRGDALQARDRQHASIACSTAAARPRSRGKRFDWEGNDFFVVPNFLWRRHINTGPGDAVLYAVSDYPLIDKIAQYRAQGRLADGTVTELGA